MIYELSGTDAADALGYSVAGGGDVNGDGKADFIVGVPFANPEGRINAGQAFVYSGADGSLLYQIDGASAGDRLGGSVGLRGDVNGDGREDFIVGAPYADPGGLTDAGSAYTYSGSGGSLLYQKDGGATGDRLGGSVGIYGDVNADGRADFIIGAAEANPGGLNDAGSAYIYSGSDGGLLYQKDGEAVGDRLGGSVGISSGVDGDANGDFIIGAPGANSSAGSAYVYSGATGNLIYQKSGQSAGDRLGGSVGLTEGLDVNGDARADVICGASGTNNSAGAVFIYSGSDGTLLFQKDGLTAGDRLGGSVGIQGDVNNDGRADFIAGAPEADVGTNPDAGNVFVYSGVSGGLLYQKSGSSTTDRLGGSVGIMGDATADGKAEFIVGAPVAGSTVGLAYVYSGATGGLLYQKNGTQTGGSFGFSVAGLGDIDGDNYPDFIVGALAASSVGLYSGSAFIYSGASGSLLYQKDGTADYSLFGSSVAGTGDLDGDGKGDLVIAARGTLSVYVYSGATGALIYAKNGADPDFGNSVAGVGDLNEDGRADFIVGAAGTYHGGLINPGAAFVYSGATGALLYEMRGSDDDRLGCSVAGAGDVNADGKKDFIVGAMRANYSEGAAYVYSGATGTLLYQKDGTSFSFQDEFGFSVAGTGDVNGDGFDDFIVGAPGVEAGSPRPNGSAFAYSGATGDLLFQIYGAIFGDRLGSSVAGAGDVNGDGKADFVIGASGSETPYYSTAGAAFVYSGVDGTLLFLKRSSGRDFLGTSVSGVGDIDGDGRDDFIIGAPEADVGEFINAGSAFVFTVFKKNVPVWTAIPDQVVNVGQPIALNVSAADPDSTIPFLSVEPLPLGATFVDSLNGRGYFSWVPNISQVGSNLLLFIASDGILADTQIVTISVSAIPGALTLFYRKNGAQSNQLGYSVAGAGDINGDGKSDFIVGAPYYSRAELSQYGGAAFVYSGTDGTVLYQKTGGPQGNGWLGSSVSGAGDVNRDGFDDFLVGDPLASPGGLTSAGSAYLYSGATGGLLYQIDGTAFGENRGWSLAGADDINGDGKADFIIGNRSGSPTSAFVYSGADGSLLYQKPGGFLVAGAGDVNGDGRADFIVDWTVYSGATGFLLYQPGIGFYSAAGAGDVNGDGFDDFIFGIPSDGAGGSAFVYSGANGSPLFEYHGNVIDGYYGEYLGYSVGGAGDVNSDGKSDFIIGSPRAGGWPFAGAAYVYSGATGALLSQINGTPSGGSGSVGDQIGSAVAGTGDVNGDGAADFIIGSPTAKLDGIYSAGSAFVYGLPCAGAKGDMNGDAVLTASDVMGMLNCVFLARGNCGSCFADVNCDGSLAPADVVLELMAVFASQPFPCPH